MQSEVCPMLTHFPISVLSLGPGYNQQSYALWSRRPVKKAVVFIHGYRGDALTTWAQFQNLIPEVPEFSGCDFLFYGHDGLWGTTAASAALFYSYLKLLFGHPLSLSIPSIGDVAARPNGFTYDKVILAAHSLGAVISRWVLLHAHDDKQKWLNRIAMVLYAPAHKGAKVSQLISELGAGDGTISTILRLMGLGAKHASPLIDELKEGGTDLQLLLDETNKALAAGGGSSLIARKVVIAERERIVVNRRFAQDPWPAATFAGTNHFSICKPTKDFLFPLECLSEAL
jgi:pimeloyl-ACP methyl ester carboxylesterase